MIKEYTKQDGTKAYMFVAYLGVDPITGKQKRTTGRGFKTKRDPKIAEAKLQTEVEEHGFRNAPKKMTFREAYEGCLSQYALTVRESSLNVVTALISKGILTELGNRNVDTITRKQAQDLVKKWHSKYKSFRKYKVYATQIMDYTVEEGAITTNPFSKVKTPRTRVEIVDDSYKYFIKDELQAFLQLAGLGVKEVQTILGRSSVKTTLDIYTHITKNQQENAAEKLAQYVSF